MNIEVALKETEIKANWDDAMLYCQFLNVNDKTDWRLPTKKELNDIYNSKHDFAGAYYWSATEHIDGNYAWVQNLSDGLQYSYFHKKVSTYVRAVRDIK